RRPVAWPSCLPRFLAYRRAQPFDEVVHVLEADVQRCRCHADHVGLAPVGDYVTAFQATEQRPRVEPAILDHERELAAARVRRRDGTDTPVEVPGEQEIEVAG